MSIITANTLFHFTKTEDKLLGILDRGFEPHYCTEFGEDMEGVIGEVKIPMVCFCDLPMSKLDKHIGTYGRYGIGLSKEWGMDKELNPVTYVHPKSFLLHSTGKMLTALSIMLNEETKEYLEYINQFRGEGKTLSFDINNPSSIKDLQRFNNPEKKLNEYTFALSSGYAILAHMKPYDNKLKERTYYDEREWRYVIPYTSQYKGDAPYLIKSEDKGKFIPLFPNQRHQSIEDYEKIIAERYMLGFKPEDIKYIIVDTNDDVIKLISHLKLGLKSKKYTSDQVDILTTKILTSKQIEQDF